MFGRLSVEIMIFLHYVGSCLYPSLNPPVRGGLLFKDGTTKPAAPVSDPVVIESSLEECASEGVHSTVDYTVKTRRSVKATFAYLICAL